MPSALQILQTYWGHNEFRPLQEEIIEAVVQKHDVLALLPTGGGKSVCYQVPAMLTEGICLVISPLIALIKDQVEALHRKGIGALSVYSGMHYMEVKKTLQNAAFGDYKFLYVSPERLETDLFLEFLPAIKPSLIVVDEAHCISQWGYDFRPSYLRIAALREHLPGVNVIAVTASATPEVQEDICTRLSFGIEKKVFTQSFIRDNISYSIFSPEARKKKMLEVLKSVPGSSLVYCKSRKATQEIAALLKMNDISADYYHAGLETSQRSLVQEKWLKNETACIVCTNAFGMGIDKPNVRLVLHYDVPESLENYYQEAGRAGRDGNRAYAVMLFEETDIAALLNKIPLKFPEEAYIKQVYTALMNNLKIAAGAGADSAHSFDLASFARYFNLNILEATYAIKALGDEGLISYNEVFFKPSSVSFTCSKEDIAELYHSDPDLEPVAKALLRSYEGIFDYTSTIYESLLAKFMQRPIEQVKENLKLLHQKGMIQYAPASDQQQVYLLQNRMYKDAFRINIHQLHERKKFFEERIRAIIAYLRNKTECRNLFIANYFGDPVNKRCGICDSCIEEKREKRTEELRKELVPLIMDILSEQSETTIRLLPKLKGYNTKLIWDTLHYLIAEKYIIKGAGELYMVSENWKEKAKKKGPR